MQRDLTAGSVTKGMLLFAGPMILGNLLQQLYNVADTLIVGQFLGAGPLAAVGSSFTLMVFLTSIILGLCMGSSVVFSMLYGARREDDLKTSFFIAFVFIAAVTLMINTLAFAFIDPLLQALQIPSAILEDTRAYLLIIFGGIGFTFIYNYFASLLRGIGNSVVPLVFLAVSALLNIVLDLALILRFNMGVSGAALATITAQGVSAVSIGIYSFLKIPALRLKRAHLRFNRAIVQDVVQYSLLTCVQQSIMNFGILMIQGLVNSFGVSVMAAFAAAVKIDSFAYMPVQDFGNAFSSFIAQNFGAGRKDRIQTGFKGAVLVSFLFCLAISAIIWIFARPLMLLFVSERETAIIAEGIRYLHIEGAFYCGIGCLFLLYGLYRALGKPGMSVVLTVISLGTRVLLAYVLSSIPAVGVVGIWWSVPIGWFLADAVGLGYFIRYRRRLL